MGDMVSEEFARWRRKRPAGFWKVFSLACRGSSKFFFFSAALLFTFGLYGHTAFDLAEGLAQLLGIRFRQFGQFLASLGRLGQLVFELVAEHAS